MKLGQGNIFRSMCQEFCPWGKGGVVGRGGTCMAQGMCGGGHVWQGGMCGGGHVWWRHVWWGMHGRVCTWWGMCMAQGHEWQLGHVRQILRDTVNERAVRILQECILVGYDEFINGSTKIKKEICLLRNTIIEFLKKCKVAWNIQTWVNKVPILRRTSFTFDSVSEWISFDSVCNLIIPPSVKDVAFETLKPVPVNVSPYWTHYCWESRMLLHNHFHVKAITLLRWPKFKLKSMVISIFWNFAWCITKFCGHLTYNKHYEMKHEMTQWKCFVQTHLVLVALQCVIG